MQVISIFFILLYISVKIEEVLNMSNKKRNQLVNREPFSGALDKTLYERLHELHERTGIPKNRLYDQAIELLLEKYKDFLK